jgi:hypothetical protein
MPCPEAGAGVQFHIVDLVEISFSVKQPVPGNRACQVIGQKASGIERICLIRQLHDAAPAIVLPDGFNGCRACGAVADDDNPHGYSRSFSASSHKIRARVGQAMMQAGVSRSGQRSHFSA